MCSVLRGKASSGHYSIDCNRSNQLYKFTKTSKALLATEVTKQILKEGIS